MMSSQSSKMPGPNHDVVAAMLNEVHLPEGVEFDTIPAPTSLAPFAWARSATISQDGITIASGNFVLLADPTCPGPWEGPWRVVTFARADLEEHFQHEDLLGEVAWSWLLEAQDIAGAQSHSHAGTVTRVINSSFGQLSDRDTSVDVELRASWSPSLENPGKKWDVELTAHVQAWITAMLTLAGLPPVPEGVTALKGLSR